MTGGCQCGRVRYEAEIDSDDAYFCHCRMCQKATGGFAAAFVQVEPGKLKWLSEPDWYESSPIARRPFCSHCGTPLGFQFQDGELRYQLQATKFFSLTGQAIDFGLNLPDGLAGLEVDGVINLNVELTAQITLGIDLATLQFNDLDSLLDALTRMRATVAAGDRGALAVALEKARTARISLPTRAPRPEDVVEVRVPVPDRAGVLAEVTTLLGELDVTPQAA